MESSARGFWERRKGIGPTAAPLRLCRSSDRHDCGPAPIRDVPLDAWTGIAGSTPPRPPRVSRMPRPSEAHQRSR